MYLPDSQLTASQVLRTFHHDELYLFLGAAFTAFGLISVAFAFLSRKFDAMLFWLGLFAILYGQRVWIDPRLLALMFPLCLLRQPARSRPAIWCLSQPSSTSTPPDFSRDSEAAKPPSRYPSHSCVSSQQPSCSVTIVAST